MRAHAVLPTVMAPSMANDFDHHSEEVMTPYCSRYFNTGGVSIPTGAMPNSGSNSPSEKPVSDMSKFRSFSPPISA
jgi:hypothetical protein